MSDPHFEKETLTPSLNADTVRTEGALEALRWCAALHLVPENALYYGSLTLAASAAAGHISLPRLPVSSATFRRWLDQWPPSQIPLSGMHCIELVTPFGGFRVFPGVFEDDDWILERLLVAWADDNDLPTELKKSVKDS